MIQYTRRTIPERHLFAVLLQHLADKGVIDIEDFYKDLDVHIEEVNKEFEGKTLFDIVLDAAKKSDSERKEHLEKCIKTKEKIDKNSSL